MVQLNVQLGYLQNPIFLHLLFLASSFRSRKYDAIVSLGPYYGMFFVMYFFHVCKRLRKNGSIGPWSLHYWNDTKITVCCKKKLKKKKNRSPGSTCLCHLQSFLLLYFKSAAGFAFFPGPQMRQTTGCGRVMVTSYILIFGNEIRTLCGSSPPDPEIYQLSLCYHRDGN